MVLMLMILGAFIGLFAGLFGWLFLGLGLFSAVAIYMAGGLIGAALGMAGMALRASQIGTDCQASPRFAPAMRTP